MTEPLETVRRRLAMRSMRRGIREMDLILQAFATAQLPHMTEGDLALYEALLEESDIEIFRWVSGQATPPARFAPLVQAISGQSVGLTQPRGA